MRHMETNGAEDGSYDYICAFIYNFKSFPPWTHSVEIFDVLVSELLRYFMFAGVMTELHHLMNTVAGQRHGQRSGRDGGHWQHPSDLTQR